MEESLGSGIKRSITDKISLSWNNISIEHDFVKEIQALLTEPGYRSII